MAECFTQSSVGGSSLDGLGGGSLSKAVLLLSLHSFQIFHSSSAGGSSSAGLLRPVVSSKLASGTASTGASFLLEMVVRLSGVSGHAVRAVASLSLSWSSTSLKPC